MQSYIYDEEDLSPLSSPPVAYSNTNFDYLNSDMDSPDSKSLYYIQKEQKNSLKDNSFKDQDDFNSSSFSTTIKEQDYDDIEKEYVDISETAYKNLINQTTELFRSSHFNTVALHKEKFAKQSELHLKDKKQLNETIKALETDYNSLNNNYLQLLQNQKIITNNILTRKEKKYGRYLDVFSIKNIFHQWKRYTEKKQLIYGSIESKAKAQGKVLLHQVFCEWKVYNKNKIWQKRIGEVKYKYDTLINDVSL